MGSSGGSSAPATVAPSYVDPVNGMSFIDDYSNPFGAPGSMPTNFKTGAQKLNEEIAQRQATEKQTSDNAAAEKQRQAAQAESEFQTRKTQAHDTAAGNINAYFQQQGLDPTAYGADINRYLDTKTQGIADLDANPYAAYGDDAGAQIVNQLTTGARGKATSSLDQYFAPNWASTAIKDDAYKPAAAHVLSSQFDPLNTQLKSASDRGMLNDAGYQQALSVMGQKQSGAQSSINKLGQGIVATDRQGLNDFSSNAYTTAGNLSLGAAPKFDASSYWSQGQGKATDYLNNMEGDLYNAVGSTKYADINELLNAGGSVQGAINPAAAGATPGMAPGALDDLLGTDKKRGLGTVGAF